MIKGYKVFKHDWTCSPNGNTKQYTCPGKFEEDVTLIHCNSGMHFCKKLIDCFNYYKFDPNNKVAEVIAYGDIVEKGNKCCTNKLEIVRELTWHEVLELVNIGKDNTGFSNSGYCNSGNRNSGYWNSGYCNSGNWNSGNWNSGDFNLSDHETGCFCTEQHKIRFFDKESDMTFKQWRNSKAYSIFCKIPFEPTKWICQEDMTEEEKEVHPEYKTAGGYLKTCDTNKAYKKWWKSLNENEKQIIKNIPNFNAEKFEQITGIKV